MSAEAGGSAAPTQWVGEAGHLSSLLLPPLPECRPGVRVEQKPAHES